MTDTDVTDSTDSEERYLLGRAVALAASAHERQIDKAGEAYILHPLRLMARARTLPEKLAALLHDVVEDSDWTLERLTAEGFPPEVVHAVDCLSRRADESYDDFLTRALSDPIAARVKLYDVEDNLNMARLGAELTESDVARLRRYHAALRRLREATRDAH